MCMQTIEPMPMHSYMYILAQVQELSEEAERLRHIHPTSADQIAAKQAEIGVLWEGLKHQVMGK